jgi:hypothetical protein
MTERQARPALPVQIWDSVCRHIDGVVIGSTMAALEQRGALRILAEGQRTGFGELRCRLSASAGYLNVAIRLMADQGWVTCTGAPGTDELTVTPTPVGHAVMTEFASAYAAAVSFLPLASRIDEIIYGTAAVPAPAVPAPAVPAPAVPAPAVPAADLGVFADLMRREWGLGPPGVDPASGQARHQVLSHLNGHLLAPLMFAMTRRGTLVAGTGIVLDGSGLRQAALILARQGWVQITGDGAKLTAAGEVAVALARQYRYPMVYLPLLRRVPELIFGGQHDDQGEGGAETHLDRELDISFSGDVFASVCRTPFLDIALPLFDREPLPGQPGLVVDMGCGDGTLLTTLYEAVLNRTERGRRIGEWPLLMVGADPSPVARRVASARLSAAGVPHVIMDGDIADPVGLGRALAALGLDARDALHVCKSAIHDRAYHPPGADVPAGSGAPGRPGADVPAGSGAPASSCAFVQPDGTAIPSAQLALNLAEFFRGWHPVTRRHGWIVIEAHAAPAVTAAGLIGRTVATALDATHGYSCQYPVEPEVFAWAAQTAGFRSRAHAEPAASALGHTILTVDHFVHSAPQTR